MSHQDVPSSTDYFDNESVHTSQLSEENNKLNQHEQASSISSNNSSINSTSINSNSSRSDSSSSSSCYSSSNSKDNSNESVNNDMDDESNKEDSSMNSSYQPNNNTQRSQLKQEKHHGNESSDDNNPLPKHSKFRLQVRAFLKKKEAINNNKMNKNNTEDVKDMKEKWSNNNQSTEIIKIQRQGDAKNKKHKYNKKKTTNKDETNEESPNKKQKETNDDFDTETNKSHLKTPENSMIPKQSTYVANANKGDSSNNDDVNAKIRSENHDNSGLYISSSKEHESTQSTARKKLDLSNNDNKLKETFNSSSETAKATEKKNVENKNDHMQETFAQGNSTKKSEDSTENESKVTLSNTFLFRTPAKNNVSKKIISKQRASSRKKNKQINMKDQKTLSQCWNKKVRRNYTCQLSI